MPTYSYRCTECDNAFDIQQAFTDSSLTACPVCGGKLRKVFGVVGVTFNGPGFYRTDSRSSADKHGAGKHHAKGEPVKSEATKSEAKVGASKSESTKSAVTSSASGTSSKTSSSKTGSTVTK